jgi:hypothetical protein
MVFPVNAGGAGKASVVILDKLYSGGSDGMCNGASGPYEARV